MLDACHSVCDFSRDEFFAAEWRFVVEQNAATGKQSIAFAVIDGDPVAVSFGNAVGAPRPEWRFFRLWRLLDFAEHLAARRLIKANRRINLPDGFKQPRHAQ